MQLLPVYPNHFTTAFTVASIAALCICNHVTSHAQLVKNTANTTNAQQDTTNEVTPAYPDSIITFEKLEMPIEMEMEFSRLQPKEALLFRDEFQQMYDGLFGQSVRTFKVWYIDDHIIGYILDKPFDAGDDKVRKCKINIPVTWCCLPAIEGHTEHCAATLTDLRTSTTSNHCTGWHIKLPPPIVFNPVGKLQKVKKSKKGVVTDSTAANFGHSEKSSSKKESKKKKGKNGFEQPQEALPTDSIGVKP